ncbi:MAG: hypothetical protein O7J95_05875 [Planctomycetota bacterium]|nr:hypothetical protein [Planctomycetota bacterium]
MRRAPFPQAGPSIAGWSIAGWWAAVVCLGFCSWRPATLAQEPAISEFLAVNRSTLEDEDRDSSDWGRGPPKSRHGHTLT